MSLFDGSWGAIGHPAEQDLGSEMSKYGVQSCASSPTLGSVPENGLTEVGILRTFTVATESTELGLLVVLSVSSSLVGG